MDFSDFSAVLLVVEVTQLFHKIPIGDRETVLQYLQDEFAGMDDEFGKIIDTVIFHMYTHHSTPELEEHLSCMEYGDIEKMTMVLQAFRDYLVDCLY